MSTIITTLAGHKIRVRPRADDPIFLNDRTIIVEIKQDDGTYREVTLRLTPVEVDVLTTLLHE